MNSYKIIIVGNSKRGKSEWVQRLLHKRRRGIYIATQGVEISSLTLSSNKVVRIWDMAGQAKYCGLSDAYYINASAALIFVDNEEEATHWLNEVMRICSPIPVFFITQNSSIFPPQLPVKNKEENPYSILKELISCIQ